MQEADLPGVLELYNHYTVTTTATFHPAPISMETLRELICLDHPWYKAFVICHDGEMAGFCFLTAFKKIEPYNRTVELGVYLKPEFTRRGLGSQAVRHLEKVAAETGRKVVIASISGENSASLELFRSLQYDECAHFNRVGEKWGRAIDVVFFQRSLEDDTAAARDAAGQSP